MLLRVAVIAVMLALAMPVPAIAQGNNQQQPGGGKPLSGGVKPPGGGGTQPPFRPGGPPSGTRTFVAPHTGPSPRFVSPGPQLVAPPAPGFVAPPAPGFVAPPPSGFAGPPPGAPAVAPHQFIWHGRPFQRAHLAPFAYPDGWAYRRWAVGAILPPLLLAPAYFYPDWAALGLDPPPPYCQWVRYGPDLLLVNVETGAIVDTIYDAFE